MFSNTIKARYETNTDNILMKLLPVRHKIKQGNAL